MPGDSGPDVGGPPADGCLARRRLLVLAGAGSRRTALRVLRDRDTLTVRRLARGVVARRRGVAPGSVDAGACDRAQTRLRHVDLPKLRDVDLVARSTDGVALCRSRPREVRTLLDAIDPGPDHAGGDDPGWAAIEALCRDPEREAVVSTLAAADGPLPVDELAARLAARRRGSTPDAVPRRVVADERVALRHVHLPVLSTTDVLAYDADAGLVRDPRLPDLHVRLVVHR